MCLLVVVSRLLEEWPLVVGANRDELYERPATAMAVLSAAAPRILGGRDLLADGTWLAVSDVGVVAALTNRPSGTGGRDPTKKSRGELPILAAREASAAEAIERLRATVRPSDYNPAWMLVGDRASLYYVDVTGDQPSVEVLPPGLHVLENRPLGAPSPKVDHVRALLAPLVEGKRTDVVGAMGTVLSNHDVPPGAEAEERPLAVAAACVHAERYGTRWSGVAGIPASASLRPLMLYTDGPSCRSERRDASILWDDARDPGQT